VEIEFEGRAQEKTPIIVCTENHGRWLPDYVPRIASGEERSVKLCLDIDKAQGNLCQFRFEVFSTVTGEPVAFSKLSDEAVRAMRVAAMVWLGVTDDDDGSKKAKNPWIVLQSEILPRELGSMRCLGVFRDNTFSI